jgi:hypothetical protein
MVSKQPVLSILFREPLMVLSICILRINWTFLDKHNAESDSIRCTCMLIAYLIALVSVIKGGKCKHVSLVSYVYVSVCCELCAIFTRRPL